MADLNPNNLNGQLGGAYGSTPGITVPVSANSGYATPANANGGFTNDPNTGKGFQNTGIASTNPVANQSTTTLSSDKTNDIAGAQAKTNALSNTGVTTNPDTGISTTANGAAYIPPKTITGTAYNGDGSSTISYSDGTTNTTPASSIPGATTATGGYYGDTYVLPGGTIPKDANGNYVSLTENPPSVQSNIDLYTKLMAQSDANTVSLIAETQAQYQQLIDQQTKNNSSQNAEATNYGISGGRGVQSAINVVHDTIGYGLQQIADLTNKENMAITQASIAGQNQNVQLQEQINSQVDEIRKEKQDAVIAQNKVIADAQSKLADQQFQEQQTTTSAINGILKDAATNGITDPKILAAIGSATSVSGAIAAAGDNLQTMTGDFADYPQYKKDAVANGVVPLSATDWLTKKQASDEALKSKEAYGTAFNTALGKAAGEAKAAGSIPTITSPVTSPQGIIYNAPASIAPYVAFASNGVKYVDLSAFAGTPTEKNQAVQDAQAAGYKVLTNKNTALDIQNITDANAKLDDMQKAFSGITSDSATQRNLYQAAITTMAKKLQTDPNVVASDVYQDAALDVLKAMSGVQGFRGGASIVQQVKTTFPSATDTTAAANAKIATLKSLISDRENALVGTPSASDQAIINEKTNENNLTTNLQSIKIANPKVYSAASTMFTSINPDSGQPYSASDILQAFPELNISK